MAASRSEALRDRAARRKVLGLSVGRPKQAPAAPVAPLDLTAVDFNAVAAAKWAEAKRLATEIASRRAAFAEEISDLVVQHKRLEAEAREFEKANARIATLMARAGAPTVTKGKRVRRPPGSTLLDQIVAHAKTHPDEPLTAPSIAAALGISKQTAANTLTRSDQVERTGRGVYRLKGTSA